MHIDLMYRYTDEKGNTVISGNLPEGVVPEETMNILTAEDGYVLVKDGEIVGCSVWLKDGDSMSNYTEIKEEQDDNG